MRLKRQRRDKAERCKLAKENENNKMVVDRRFDKEKELASKSAQPEQSNPPNLNLINVMFQFLIVIAILSRKHDMRARFCFIWSQSPSLNK